MAISVFDFKVSFNDKEERQRFIDVIKEICPQTPFTLSWLAAIGWCVVRAPDEYAKVLTGKEGPMRTAGFYGSLRDEDDRNDRSVQYCGGCHQPMFYWPEEQNIWQSFQGTPKATRCGFVDHVQRPGRNTKHNCFAIVRKDWAVSPATGVAYRWKHERSEARSSLCEPCIDDAISGGDLIPIDGACGSCGDHHEPVRCAHCNHDYGCGYGGSMTQATYCASQVFTNQGAWFISSGYGSSHDLSLYLIPSPTPTLTGNGLGLDPVCDPCIDKLLMSDRLELVTEDAMHFEFPTRQSNAGDN